MDDSIFLNIFTFVYHSCSFLITYLWIKRLVLPILINYLSLSSLNLINNNLNYFIDILIHSSLTFSFQLIQLYAYQLIGFFKSEINQLFFQICLINLLIEIVIIIPILSIYLIIKNNHNEKKYILILLAWFLFISNINNFFPNPFNKIDYDYNKDSIINISKENDISLLTKYVINIAIFGIALMGSITGLNSSIIIYNYLNESNFLRFKNNIKFLNYNHDDSNIVLKYLKLFKVNLLKDNQNKNNTFFQKLLLINEKFMLIYYTYRYFVIYLIKLPLFVYTFTQKNSVEKINDNNNSISMILNKFLNNFYYNNTNDENLNFLNSIELVVSLLFFTSCFMGILNVFNNWLIIFDKIYNNLEILNYNKDLDLESNIGILRTPKNQIISNDNLISTTSSIRLTNDPNSTPINYYQDNSPINLEPSPYLNDKFSKNNNDNILIPIIERLILCFLTGIYIISTTLLLLSSISYNSILIIIENLYFFKDLKIHYFDNIFDFWFGSINFLIFLNFLLIDNE